MSRLSGKGEVIPLVVVDPAPMPVAITGRSNHDNTLIVSEGRGVIHHRRKGKHVGIGT
jgi:hypothetical protein